MTTKEWEQRYYETTRRWRRAVEGIDQKSPLGEFIGSLVWGRHGADIGRDSGKDAYVSACGYLDGYRDAMITASWSPAVSDDVREQLRERFGSKFYERLDQ